MNAIFQFVEFVCRHNGIGKPNIYIFGLFVGVDVLVHSGNSIIRGATKKPTHITNSNGIPNNMALSLTKVGFEFVGVFTTGNHRLDTLKFLITGGTVTDDIGFIHGSFLSGRNTVYHR
jgi:hypothetical protein